jgi:hypothetical protein
MILILIAQSQPGKQFLKMSNIYFLFFFIVFCGFLYKILKKSPNKLPVDIIIFSFFYHLLFCFIYWYYSLFNSADSINYYYSVYYSSSSNWFSLFGFGTQFIKFFLYPFIKYLHLSYFSCFLVFNFFGFLGIFLFYITLRKKIFHHLKLRKLLNLLLFIPGLNFWSTAIGKDSLIIFGLGLFFYAFANQKIKWIILSFVIILLVRPYMLFFILTALGLAFLFSKVKKGLIFKIGGLLLVFIVFVGFKNMIFDYVGLDFLQNISTTEVVSNYTDYRQSVSSRGGSAVKIAEYNLISRIFTYLFRPLFFDVKNLMMLVVSFENLFYLVLVLPMLFSRNFYRFLFKNKDLYFRFHLFFFLIVLLVFSSMTGNLGIAVRQKTMIMFSLFNIILLYKCSGLDKKAE